MASLKQQLQKADRKVYNTPICGSPLYQERDVIEAVKAWLEQKRLTDGDGATIIENMLIDELLEELKEA